MVKSKMRSKIGATVAPDRNDRARRGVKRYQTGAVTPPNTCDLPESALLRSANVKKVSNGHVQGLDPGEIGFGDLPFRLKKSRK